MEKTKPPRDDVYRYNKNTGALEVAMYGAWTEALHDTSHDVVLPSPSLFSGYPDFHVFTRAELKQLVLDAKSVNTGFRRPVTRRDGRCGSGFETDSGRKGMPVYPEWSRSSILDGIGPDSETATTQGPDDHAEKSNFATSTTEPLVSREEMELLMSQLETTEAKPRFGSTPRWLLPVIAVLVMIAAIVFFTIQSKPPVVVPPDSNTISTVPEYSDPTSKL